LEVYSSVFIHYDNLLTCVYTPIHADTAAGIIVEPSFHMNYLHSTETSIYVF
jgi:hypothetical protein